MQASHATDVGSLTRVFGSRLVTPDAPDYDEVRRLHNGLVDKRPALIARGLGNADIREAIAFARQAGLPIAIRGGGHNVSGRASVDGGMMIDLSLMKGIRVDARARRAWVQGGVTWGELNRETQLHALATTGGFISTTGVAGLTLGGGLGHLMGMHGLAVDNLQRVELVTADGRVLQASAEDNPDLFWALRGGGGNFGVASSFEFRLHPVGPIVTAGLVVHPLAAGRGLLRLLRDFAATAPDDVSLFGALGTAPDGSGAKIAGIAVAYFGPAAEAATALKPLRAFGTPVLDTIGPMEYSVLNTLFDAALPRGAKNYWKSSFLRELSDQAIDTIVGAFEHAVSPMTQIGIEYFHGAVCRVPRDATAFPHRDTGFNLLVLGQWSGPAETEREIRWTRETYAAVQPFVGSGRYVNYLDDDEPGDPAAQAYGPNYRRLQEIKAQYDPENCFRQNQNITPLG
jgi:FAD/FMN-containing dehydrogenase